MRACDDRSTSFSPRPLRQASRQAGRPRGRREAPEEAEAIYHWVACYVWALLLAQIDALLLAQIDEVFPLVCSHYGGEMRIIAFIADAGAVREILSHLGEPTLPLRLMKAPAPPLWERQGATLGEDESQPQSVPKYEFDRRIAG